MMNVFYFVVHININLKSNIVINKENFELLKMKGASSSKTKPKVRKKNGRKDSKLFVENKIFSHSPKEQF